MFLRNPKDFQNSYKSQRITKSADKSQQVTNNNNKSQTFQTCLESRTIWKSLKRVQQNETQTVSNGFEHLLNTVRTDFTNDAHNFKTVPIKY